MFLEHCFQVQCEQTPKAAVAATAGKQEPERVPTSCIANREWAAASTLGRKDKGEENMQAFVSKAVTKIKEGEKQTILITGTPRPTFARLR